MPAADGNPGGCLFASDRKGSAGMSAFWHGNISKRFFRVWQRNFTVYQKIWKISFLPPLFEPLFYLLAFGIGFGALVGKIKYQGT